VPGERSSLKNNEPITSIGFLLYSSVAVDAVFEMTCCEVSSTTSPDNSPFDPALSRTTTPPAALSVALTIDSSA
jgi:hypothetical protein